MRLNRPLRKVRMAEKRNDVKDSKTAMSERPAKRKVAIGVGPLPFHAASMRVSDLLDQ